MKPYAKLTKILNNDSSLTYQLEKIVDSTTVASWTFENLLNSSQLFRKLRYFNEDAFFKEKDGFLNLRKASFLNETFDKCTIPETDFSKGSFVKVVFRDCQFSDCSFKKAFFDRVFFYNCTFSNCDFGKLNVTAECVWDGGWSVDNCTFSECIFKDADLLLFNNVRNSNLFLRSDFWFLGYRSDGYGFYAQTNSKSSKGLFIKAGCRYFSMEEAEKHWSEERYLRVEQGDNENFFKQALLEESQLFLDIAKKRFSIKESMDEKVKNTFNVESIVF